MHAIKLRQTMFISLLFGSLLFASSIDSTISKKKAEWKIAIDNFWGPGLPTNEKLEIFDKMWNDIDQNYGAFTNHPVNIDSLRELYRPEIEAGVSKGRFVAIMNHFALALRDLHTWLINVPVNWGTALNRGTPLFVVGAWRENRRFGAVLTPLPDSSLLVLRVASFQGIFLKPGDIILGYDGVPWKTWYKVLMEAQMPVFWRITGSTKESFDHMMLQSAGLNWHLFDTIDVLKYESSDTLHFSTGNLASGTRSIFGNEQMVIPGVSMPDFLNEDFVSYGIIEGTKIGYIYVSSWNASRPELQIREQFLEAIEDLTINQETNGLIIDSRFNTGGNMSPALDGYSLLFNEDNDQFGGFDLRGDPDDHFGMVPHPFLVHSNFIIKADPNTYYDKPIALLIGPNSVSAGDNESLRITYHPMVRSFGLPTNGAFTLSDFPDLGNSEWNFQKATGASFEHADRIYLDHTPVIPDERIWFDKDDVANGDDTVVKAAVNWMQNLVHAHATSIVYKQDSIQIVTKIENLQEVSISAFAVIQSLDSSIVDTITLFDDGQHDNGIAGDNLWGNFYKPDPHNFATYFVDIETTNLTNQTTWVLPKATRFTTNGPMALKDISFSENDSVPNPGDGFIIRLTLKNTNLFESVNNVVANLSSKDLCVSSFQINDKNFGNFAVGSEKTGTFNIKLSEDCNGSERIKIILRVASDGFYYWQDSLFLQLSPTSIDEKPANIPGKFSLDQNYPNPFNPQTTINYNVPRKSNVELSVYNVLGQRINQLENQIKEAGQYSVVWNGNDDSGKTLPSGLYFIQLAAGNFVQTRKAIFFK